MIFRSPTRKGSLPFLVFMSLAVSLFLVANGAAAACVGTCSMSKAPCPQGKEMLSHGCCCEKGRAAQGSCVDAKARVASLWSSQAAFSFPRGAMAASFGLGPALSALSPEVLQTGPGKPDISPGSRTVYLANLSLLC